jgi:hypothetical protein
MTTTERPTVVESGTERFNLRLLVWSGPVCIVTVLLGWMVLAGFLPPPAPSLSRAEAIEVWRDHTNVKRLGLILCVWGGTLYVTFSMAVYYALRRSGQRILAGAQAALGVFGTVFFTLNFFVLSMVPFRLDTDPEGIQPLHDLGFAMTFSPVPPFTFQYLLIALAILQGSDVFPRWVGYVNVFCAVLLIPPCLIPMFRTGPLAWNGLFSFWIPVIEFTAWFFVMFWAMNSSLTRQAR